MASTLSDVPVAEGANIRIDEETANKWESEQHELKQKLVEEDTEEWETSDPPFSGLQRIGGVDISFVKTSTSLACVSLVVCTYPELEILYEDCHTVHLTQPYMSGFLAFREVPFFLECLDKLKNTKPDLAPQVIFVDGNGILHPRGFGTACHLGVLSGIPTVGIAKKLIQVDNLQKDDQHSHKVAALESGGDSFDLIGESGKVWGKALRSCGKSVNPIFISVGHRITLETATALVKSCCRHRIPEPVRQADIRSREFLRQAFPEHYPASASASASAKKKKSSGSRQSGNSPPPSGNSSSSRSNFPPEASGAAVDATTEIEDNPEEDNVKSRRTIQLQEEKSLEDRPVSGCACS